MTNETIEKVQPLIIPEIKALPRFDGVGGFQFWCAWCRKWHLHGIGEGHRAEHCTDPDSPFQRIGYVLKRLAKTELRDLSRSIIVGMSKIERRRLLSFIERVGIYDKRI